MRRGRRPHRADGLQRRVDVGDGRDADGLFRHARLHGAGAFRGAPDRALRATSTALACSCFYLLSGRVPVEAGSLAELKEAHARGARTRLRDLRPELPEASCRSSSAPLRARSARSVISPQENSSTRSPERWARTLPSAVPGPAASQGASEDGATAALGDVVALRRDGGPARACGARLGPWPGMAGLGASAGQTRGALRRAVAREHRELAAPLTGRAALRFRERRRRRGATVGAAAWIRPWVAGCGNDGQGESVLVARLAAFSLSSRRGS